MHSTHVSRLVSWLQRCNMEVQNARAAWEPSAIRFWQAEADKARNGLRSHFATYAVRNLPA